MESKRELFAGVFGQDRDSILVVQKRAYDLFGRDQCIVWEGDPQTFQFLHVSDSAERLLGYPSASWLASPGFWAEKVVHPDDQKAAIAYCALATGQCKDHDFIYRAVCRDGRVISLHDIVNVVSNGGRIPIRLRGIMFPIREGTIIHPIFDRVEKAA